ncbi:MAG: UPF0147 family protein [Methanocellales archaeon]|nr:UPF0147 family protein [Methanocellales archaeon]
MSVDSEKIIKQCISDLEHIMGDRSVPRNIRRAAEGVKARLLGVDESPTVRVASAIAMLDEVCADPNIPLYTRTLVWGVVSQLEAISVDR